MARRGRRNTDVPGGARRRTRPGVPYPLQVGNFPPLWAEWNGLYRDTLRAFWKGDALLLSQGVPMLSGGDEIARTQGGNNNAYCQDNETSWHAWQLDGSQRALLRFTRLLIGLRKRHPGLRRRQFFFGRKIRGSEVKDLSWFRPDGQPRPRSFRGGQTYPLEARSLALFRLGGTTRSALSRRGAEPADILG